MTDALRTLVEGTVTQTATVKVVAIRRSRWRPRRFCVELALADGSSAVLHAGDTLNVTMKTQITAP